MNTLKRLLDSPYNNRTIITPYLFFGNELIYLSYMLYFLASPSPFLQLSIVQNRAILHTTMVATSLLLIYFYKKLQSTPVLEKALPYFVINFYVCTLVYDGYTIGHYSLAAGLIFGSFPIVGLMIYKRRVVYSAVVLATALYCVLTILCVLKIIPYAPLWQVHLFDSTAGRAFYFSSVLYWVTPCIVFVFFASDTLVQIWHRREMAIHKLSMTDSLVNTGNRRFIVDFLEQTLAASKKAPQPFSTILLDIDHFKAVNDNYGHPTGDKVLKSVSRTILKNLRANDKLGRYGGEEFLIVLPQTSLEEAKHIAERCRHAIAAIQLKSVDNMHLVPIRASFGVYTCENAHSTVDDIIKVVDKQLYRAKHKGRNNVAWVGQMDEPTIANDAISKVP